MKQTTVLSIVLALVTAACGEQKATPAVDAGVDTRAVSDVAPEAEPSLDLPRPME